MSNTLRIKCPCCTGEIIADIVTGEVLSHNFVPQKKETRSLSSLIKEIGTHSQKIQEKFEQQKESQKNRKKTLDEIFEESLKKVDRDAPPPKRLIDD